MNGVFKGMLIMLMIMYVISPVDAMPGAPVDDIIVILLGLAGQKRLSAQE